MLRKKVLLPALAIALGGVIVAVLVLPNVFEDDEPVIHLVDSNIRGVPGYPGGTRISGILRRDLPGEMQDVIGDSDAEWAAYRTGDAIEDIAFFYQREIAARGYASVELDVSALMLWEDEERRYGIYVIIDRVQNHVVVASSPR